MPDAFPQVDWVFFDLDGTLWDHSAASSRAIMQVCTRYGLSPMAFLPTFRSCNDIMWRDLAVNGGGFPEARIRRFEMALAHSACGCSTLDAEEVSAYYMTNYLQAPSLHEGAVEAVEAAAERCRVAIVTNGPHDTQDKKVSDLGPVSERLAFVLCAEDVRALKPSPLYFIEAARRAGDPEPGRILIVGDSACDDITHPSLLGWKTAWISQGKESPTNCIPSFLFRSLSEVASWISR